MVEDCFYLDPIKYYCFLSEVYNLLEIFDFTYEEDYEYLSMVWGYFSNHFDLRVGAKQLVLYID